MPPVTNYITDQTKLRSSLVVNYLHVAALDKLQLCVKLHHILTLHSALFLRYANLQDSTAAVLYPHKVTTVCF